MICIANTVNAFKTAGKLRRFYSLKIPVKWQLAIENFNHDDLLFHTEKDQDVALDQFFGELYVQAAVTECIVIRRKKLKDVEKISELGRQIASSPFLAANVKQIFPNLKTDLKRFNDVEVGLAMKGAIRKVYASNAKSVNILAEFLVKSYRRMERRNCKAALNYLGGEVHSKKSGQYGYPFTATAKLDGLRKEASGYRKASAEILACYKVLEYHPEYSTMEKISMHPKDTKSSETAVDIDELEQFATRNRTGW
jgi:hypothetical protein